MCIRDSLPAGHGRFSAGILDVYCPYAVFYGKQKLPAESFCQGKQKPATDAAQCFPADSLFDFYRTAELF